MVRPSRPEERNGEPPPPERPEMLMAGPRSAAIEPTSRSWGRPTGAGTIARPTTWLEYPGPPRPERAVESISVANIVERTGLVGLHQFRFTCRFARGRIRLPASRSRMARTRVFFAISANVKIREFNPTARTVWATQKRHNFLAIYRACKPRSPSDGVNTRGRTIRARCPGPRW